MGVELGGAVIQQDSYYLARKHRDAMTNKDNVIARLNARIEEQDMLICKHENTITELKEKIGRDRITISNLKMKLQEK